MKERISDAISKGNDKGILGPWERSFLDSLLSQVEKRPLSVKQNNWLQKIETKITDAYDETWEQQWDEEKAKNVRIAVGYYQRENLYFTTILQWIKDNPESVLPKPHYKKLVENKYAQKIIKALNTAPIFQTGEKVSLRATAKNIRSGSPPYRRLDPAQDKLFFVLSPLDKALSAVKGARIYRVLCATETIPIEIEERHLKKYRIPKKNKNS